MELLQCKTSWAIIDTLRGSSREKHHQGLCLESLQQQKWC